MIRNFTGMFDDGLYKNATNIMHLEGCKNNYFNSDGVSMMVLGCGVPQFTQFCEKSMKIHKMSPHPYVGNYNG